MVDARDCETARTTVQWSGSGYFREFSSDAFLIEQSDRVLGTGQRDIVHQGPGTCDKVLAIHTDGTLWCRGRVVVPQSADLREKILKEFHCSRFVVHPGGTKMYRDLRLQYY